jgi:CRP/FNR family transcriptional regulator, dissimilatory nitrate respiration regulator
MEDRFLDYIPLFAGLPEEDMKKLNASGIYRSFKPGELIAGPSERVRAFFIVVWGMVKLYRSSPEGHEQTLYIFGPGEPFCMTALEDGTFPADASALTETRIFILPADVMESIARSEPALLLNIMSVLIKRLKETMHLIEMLSMKEVPQRLAAWLIHSSVIQGGIDMLHPGMTHRELSKLLGTTPESISRAFRRFKDEGALEINGRIIKILNRKLLVDIASNGFKPKD